jgi:hypothetical protein
VQVCHGTGAYVKGPKTIAYIGRIEGYNEALGEWKVDFLTRFPNPSPNPFFNAIPLPNPNAKLRNTMLNKRGEPNKVDEAFMSPVKG